MAMRPHIKRNGLLIIGFAIIQCVIIQVIVHQQLIDLSRSHRIGLYTVSGIACATLILLGLLYMAVKGNPETNDD